MKAKKITKAKPKEAKPRGRPSVKTPEVCTEIVERLSSGEPLAQICRDERMPKVRTVYDWMDGDEQFAADIARAREDGHDAIAAEALEIADDGRRDYKRGPRGGLVVDQDHIQRSRLRVETRLKLLAKWDPKRYGDRLSAELSGPDGGPIKYAHLSDEDLEREIVQRAAALGLTLVPATT